MSFLQELKKYLGKFWFLLWKDDSFKGWLFSIIFLFIFIKFIFFPGLSLLTGTPLPLAIVESCSMYHQGGMFSNFDSWWVRHNIKYSASDINETTFQGFGLKNGLDKGDILFVIGANPDSLNIGDIIIYNAGQGNPVIHRIINITNINGSRTFSTEGDNNNGQIFFENGIRPEQIIGKPIFKIAPYLGWVKLIFFEGSKPQQERGFCRET